MIVKQNNVAKLNYVLLADYNQRMNESVFNAAFKLSSQELLANRGAFFGSILGTLNHILVGDIIWLKRFADHPAELQVLDPMRRIEMPRALHEMLYPVIDDLASARMAMDILLKNFTSVLTDEVLLSSLQYRNSKGQVFTKNMSHLIQHLFNHQTHHRGQVSTLLYQAGVDIGVTDLLIDVPDSE